MSFPDQGNTHNPKLFILIFKLSATAQQKTKGLVSLHFACCFYHSHDSCVYHCWVKKFLKGKLCILFLTCLFGSVIAL